MDPITDLQILAIPMRAGVSFIEKHPRLFAALAVVATILVLLALLHHDEAVIAKGRVAVAAAQDHTTASNLTGQGQQQQAARVDAFNHLDLTVHDAASAAVAAAGAAPDAKTFLDPARADRLRAFDDQLCALRPPVCGGPETLGGGAAGAGGGSSSSGSAVPSTAPSGRPGPV